MFINIVKWTLVILLVLTIIGWPITSYLVIAKINKIINDCHSSVKVVPTDGLGIGEEDLQHDQQQQFLNQTSSFAQTTTNNISSLVQEEGLNLQFTIPSNIMNVTCDTKELVSGILEHFETFKTYLPSFFYIIQESLRLHILIVTVVDIIVDLFGIFVVICANVCMVILFMFLEGFAIGYWTTTLIIYKKPFIHIITHVFNSNVLDIKTETNLEITEFWGVIALSILVELLLMVFLCMLCTESNHHSGSHHGSSGSRHKSRKKSSRHSSHSRR